MKMISTNTSNYKTSSQITRLKTLGYSHRIKSDKKTPCSKTEYNGSYFAARQCYTPQQERMIQSNSQNLRPTDEIKSKAKETNGQQSIQQESLFSLGVSQVQLTKNTAIQTNSAHSNLANSGSRVKQRSSETNVNKEEKQWIKPFLLNSYDQNLLEKKKIHFTTADSFISNKTKENEERNEMQSLRTNLTMRYSGGKSYSGFISRTHNKLEYQKYPNSDYKNLQVIKTESDDLQEIHLGPLQDQFNKYNSSIKQQNTNLLTLFFKSKNSRLDVGELRKELTDFQKQIDNYTDKLSKQFKATQSDNYQSIAQNHTINNYNGSSKVSFLDMPSATVKTNLKQIDMFSLITIDPQMEIQNLKNFEQIQKQAELDNQQIIQNNIPQINSNQMNDVLQSNPSLEDKSNVQESEVYRPKEFILNQEGDDITNKLIKQRAISTPSFQVKESYIKHGQISKQNNVLCADKDHYAFNINENQLYQTKTDLKDNLNDTQAKNSDQSKINSFHRGQQIQQIKGPKKEELRNNSQIQGRDNDDQKLLNDSYNDIQQRIQRIDEISKKYIYKNEQRIEDVSQKNISLEANHIKQVSILTGNRSFICQESVENVLNVMKCYETPRFLKTEGMKYFSSADQILSSSFIGNPNLSFNSAQNTEETLNNLSQHDFSADYEFESIN